MDLKSDLVIRALPEVAQEYPLEVFKLLKGGIITENVVSDIPDAYTRQRIVEVARVLAEKRMEAKKKDRKKLAKAALWIVTQFMDDPDPYRPEINRYGGRPEFNYHQRIIDSEDVMVITTVRGSIAWVLYQLIPESDKEAFLEVYEKTKKLLNDPNLYVVQQALIPLTTVVGNRKRLRSAQKGELHDLLFELLRKYHEYQSLAKYLLHVFDHYRELNEEEALEVLEKLEKVEDSAGLFIYYAVYRKNHFKEKRGFDSERFEELLKTKIKSGAENLRGKITWHLWRVLNNSPKEFNVLKGYIKLGTEALYTKETFPNLLRITEEHVKNHPEECVGWFENLLDRSWKFLQTEEGRVTTPWLRAEGIVGEIARRDPERFVELMRKLYKLWVEGAYIGNLKEIFESYQSVPKPQRPKVKSEIKKIYREMKELNPSLIDVNWRKS